MSHSKDINILVCPLDWGLGHLTRSEVIVDRLIKRGCRVIVAGTKKQLSVYSDHTGFEKIRFGSYKVRYSRFLPQQLAVFFQAPLLLIQYLADRIRLGIIIKKYDIDIVISDNRFGAHSGRAYSVYVTHQLTVKAGRSLRFAEPLITKLHRMVIKRYDECWVPDFEEAPGLAGDLSHPGSKLSDTRYIGLLSRLENVNAEPVDEMPEKPFTLLLLSGPEPQRTILEKIICNIFIRSEKNLVIVAGKPGKIITGSKHGITTINYLEPGRLVTLIREAKDVICRAGYTSLMEMFLMERPALIVPTPGQPEQEYLARNLSSHPLFEYRQQPELKEIQDIERKERFRGKMKPEDKTDLLEAAISDLLDKHHRDKQ